MFRLRRQRSVLVSFGEDRQGTGRRCRTQERLNGNERPYHVPGKGKGMGKCDRVKDLYVFQNAVKTSLWFLNHIFMYTCMHMCLSLHVLKEALKSIRSCDEV